jgi:hypothetical protein
MFQKTSFVPPDIKPILVFDKFTRIRRLRGLWGIQESMHS